MTGRAALQHLSYGRWGKNGTGEETPRSPEPSCTIWPTHIVLGRGERDTSNGSGNVTLPSPKAEPVPSGGTGRRRKRAGPPDATALPQPAQNGEGFGEPEEGFPSSVEQKGGDPCPAGPAASQRAQRLAEAAQQGSPPPAPNEMPRGREMPRPEQGA